MEERELGRSGIAVSRVILGCGNFGGMGSVPELFGKGESDEEAAAIMDAAWELGIRAFDTADAYGGGRSERAIGRWLARQGPEVREQLVLTTKTFNPMDAGADSGLSRSRILRQLDSSLERLGVERVDLYLTHETPDPETPLEETLRALDELVRSGKVRTVGASNVDAATLERSLATSAEHGLARFESVQNSYSLLERVGADGVLALCERNGLGFTPFSPLAGGWLAGRYRRGEPPPPGSRLALRPEPYAHLDRPKTWDALEELGREAAARGISTAGLSLAWLLADPRVSAVIVGPRRPEHLEPAREALGLDLDAADRDRLGALFG
jgi:aryl-alcohol dehydrogenase-like predicted oxidoreductase